MRVVSMCVKCFLAAVLVIGIYAGTAAAQVTPPPGLTIWDVSEWQLSVTPKGYEFDDPTSPPSGKVTGTTKLQAVMNVIRTPELTVTGEIVINLYESGGGACAIATLFDPLVLNFVAGDSTAFIAEVNPATSALPIKGLLYFSGKSNSKGWNGKVETLGAYVYGDLNPFEGIGINIKGSIKDLKCDRP